MDQGSPENYVEYPLRSGIMSRRSSMGRMFGRRTWERVFLFPILVYLYALAQPQPL